MLNAALFDGLELVKLVAYTMIMKKKLIFLDGDGTLWYPKATKRTQKPHWVYSDPKTKDFYLEHLELTPGTKEALEIFPKKNMYLVVISANPNDEVAATKELKERLEYFAIADLFYTYRSSGGSDPNGKARIMLEVINELRLRSIDAVMVGDSYFYDYLAATHAGIDAFFIKNSVSKMPEVLPSDINIIAEVKDLLKIIE